ncbi:MAG: hypothetical protein AAGA57_07840 [Planctomycetota bacterium]
MRGLGLLARFWCVVCLALALCLAGCQTGGTTRVQIADYQEVADRMALSLRDAPAIRGRTPASEPWVVTMSGLENRSTEVLTEAERWYVLARIRAAQPIDELWDRHALRFVVPRERWDLLRSGRPEEFAGDDFGGGSSGATHTLDGTLRTVTRAQSHDRTDLFLLEFQLLDLRTGEPVWLDRFEFKRAAAGFIWD